jgi:hypothetical protein
MIAYIILAAILLQKGRSSAILMNCPSPPFYRDSTWRIAKRARARMLFSKGEDVMRGWDHERATDSNWTQPM